MDVSKWQCSKCKDGKHAECEAIPRKAKKLCFCANKVCFKARSEAR